MTETTSTVNAITSILAALTSQFMGGCDGLLYALLVFVIIDYISGVLCAIVSRSLSSKIGFRGITGKVMIFVMVMIGATIDMHLIGTGTVLRNAVVCFYLCNEFISITENAVKLGVPIPDKIIQFLESFKAKANVKVDVNIQEEPTK